MSPKQWQVSLWGPQTARAFLQPASSGLPWFSRWTYIEFYSRYGILMTKQELSFSDKKEVCKVVLHRLIQVSPPSWNHGLPSTCLIFACVSGP